MLNRHFTKLINYTTLPVSSVSLKQSHNILAQGFSGLCSSRQRQSSPSTCSCHWDGV